MCLCFVSIFRRHIVFRLLAPTFTKATEKSAFGEKRPLNGKFSKFRHEIITDRRLMYGKMFTVEKFVILSFREICTINGVKTLMDLQIYTVVVGTQSGWVTAHAAH